jgi:hypothetical protein
MYQQRIQRWRDLGIAKSEYLIGKAPEGASKQQREPEVISKLMIGCLNPTYGTRQYFDPTTAKSLVPSSPYRVYDIRTLSIPIRKNSEGMYEGRLTYRLPASSCSSSWDHWTPSTHNPVKRYFGSQTWDDQTSVLYLGMLDWL